MAKRNKGINRLLVEKKRAVAPPITSDRDFEQRKLDKKEIARKNKARSKDQERKVAKYLQGNRTPMSGAGWTKGDVRVDFTNRPGHYMIECKMTAYVDKNGAAMIKVMNIWFSKLQKESEAMRSLFGVLIIGFYYQRLQFVLMREEDYIKISRTIITDVPIIDKSTAKTKAISLYESSLRTATTNGPAKIIFPFGTYYVFRLEEFKQLMDGV